mgnify:CR=1 FL=1
MLGAQKQKAWLSDQSFAKKFGLPPLDFEADRGCALSFDGILARVELSEDGSMQQIDLAV